jgi:hypothetical protein
METIRLQFYFYQNDDQIGLSKRVKTYVTSPNVQFNTVYEIVQWIICKHAVQQPSVDIPLFYFTLWKYKWTFS